METDRDGDRDEGVRGQEESRGNGRHEHEILRGQDQSSRAAQENESTAREPLDRAIATTVSTTNEDHHRTPAGEMSGEGRPSVAARYAERFAPASAKPKCCSV